MILMLQKKGKMSFRKATKTVFTTENEQSPLELDESLGAGLEYDEIDGGIPTNVAFVHIIKLERYYNVRKFRNW